MKVSPLFILSLAFGVANSCYMDTLSGPVKGFVNHVNGYPVKAFWGVPFAEPPVGNLRFKRPEPVKPWTSILNATRFPPACEQYTAYPFPWYDPLPGKSEDCLYLNIFAPIEAEHGMDLAVMVWIHGGGFISGSTRLDDYDASALAMNGNVIVVTFNYRLNLFGFATSNTEDAPGNAGMYDILMALQWVNDNIKTIGGDKTRITVFGESAGSMAVSLLCASPLAKGLFTRAILQSGSSIVLDTNPLEANLHLTQRLAQDVGCASQDQTIETHPAAVIGCLRNQTADHLSRVLSSFNPTSACNLFPQYGDDLLPRNFADEMRDGHFHDVPLLIGNVADEGGFLVTTAQPVEFGFFGHMNPTINKTHAGDMIRGMFSGFDNPEKYVEHYLNDTPDGDYDAIRHQVIAAMGDRIINCETVYFAERYADKKNDVYYFMFSHRPSTTIWAPWTGVAHTEEIPFVFGRPIRKPQLYQPVEVELSKKMVEVWTNFAKHGKPSESFDWPKYSKENPTFVHIDTDFKGDHYGTGPHRESCNLMREHFGF